MSSIDIYVTYVAIRTFTPVAFRRFDGPDIGHRGKCGQAGLPCRHGPFCERRDSTAEITLRLSASGATEVPNWKRLRASVDFTYVTTANRTVLGASVSVS